MKSTETKITETDIEKHIIINRWDRGLVVIACFFLFVGSVLAGVSVWQGTQRNRRIDHIDKVVTEAKEATEDSRDTLKAAIAAQNTPEARRPLQQLNDIHNDIQKILEYIQEHS